MPQELTDPSQSLILKNKEKLVSLVDGYEQVTGKRPHLSVPWRHSQYGVGGVRLEFVIFGNRRMTSIEAVHRFIVARTGPRMSRDAIVSANIVVKDRERSRKRRIDKANATIERLTESPKGQRKKQLV